MKVAVGMYQGMGSLVVCQQGRTCISFECLIRYWMLCSVVKANIDISVLWPCKYCLETGIKLNSFKTMYHLLICPSSVFKQLSLDQHTITPSLWLWFRCGMVFENKICGLTSSPSLTSLTVLSWSFLPSNTTSQLESQEWFTIDALKNRSS